MFAVRKPLTVSGECAVTDRFIRQRGDVYGPAGAHCLAMAARDRGPPGHRRLVSDNREGLRGAYLDAEGAPCAEVPVHGYCDVRLQGLPEECEAAHGTVIGLFALPIRGSTFSTEKYTRYFGPRALSSSAERCLRVISAIRAGLSSSFSFFR